MRILGIPGSLRASSYNRALLRAAAELLPDGAELEIAEIGDLPLFNDDVLAAGSPDSVRRLKEAVRAADALLFATPEYNYSMPGLLKNAIDWVSRPPAESPLAGKPVAIMGASTGAFGTTRAQHHLRQVCAGTGMVALAKPELTVARAAEQFDADGRLTDEASRAQLGKLLAALVRWTEALRGFSA